MRAVEIQGPGRFVIVERPDPSYGRGQIVVRIKAPTLSHRNLYMV